jgi:lantibiotic biosynthesis protein
MTTASPAPAQPSGFFVLRTPLLPAETISDWSGAPEAADVEDLAGAEDAIAGDRLRLRARLAEILADPVFREAVFLASPSLEAAIESWRTNPESERGQRAESSLVAYLMRAAARPTPFGLFAGWTTGRIGNDTQLRLAGRDGLRRHTRLDMDYLWTLSKALTADPALRADLCYRPNSSCYEAGGRLLYAETREHGDVRSYHLVAATSTPYLAETLERARDGERLEALADALVSDDITVAEASAYVAELADSQLLVADCEPPVTGAPAGLALGELLSARPRTAAIAAGLAEAQAGLAAVDAAGAGASPDAYRRIARPLAGLPAAPDLDRFVQVDLMTTAVAATLGEPVVAEILRGAQTLHAVAQRGEGGALDHFRDQFARRYETREMPLAQVLDPESGIGFASPGQIGAGDASLLASLPISRHHERARAWTRRDAFLYRKLAAAVAAGAGQITIGAAEADNLREDGDLPLPDAFDVLAVLVAASPEAIGRGQYQVLIGSVGGPSGARLLGRFCHADDDLRALTRAHLRAEEEARPDCVFAEVVHLPHGRTGNILSRPVLRDYEIPYLGRSGAPADRQLPVSDLLVSVQGERIVLRSARLGREVIPRLTAAHHFGRGGQAVYRFLCALQHQGVSAGAMWDWGPLRGTPFLPRVVSGRAVLSRATWNLGEAELTAFAQARGARQFLAVRKLRERLDLPRWVVLADADNELVADLDNVLCVEALARQVRRRQSAALVELLPGLDQLCVSGREGRFAHQVIVPFVRAPQPPDRQPRPTATPAATSASAGAVVRRFPPGSQWLYLKLFTGQAGADRVLLDVVQVLTAAAGSIDSWHFVRFADPDWHIRLRLHGRPDALLHDVLPSLRDWADPLLQAGLLWRIQLDTYEREVERYGGPDGIEYAEHIFHADSAAILQILRLLPGDAGADGRWRVALRGIDQLLEDFGLSLPEKREIARAARQGYGREFGVGAGFQHAVGACFRRERTSLEPLLDRGRDLPHEWAACAAALDRRSAAIAASVARLRALAGSDQARLAELTMSLAHMHVNRLLRSAQRAQELVLYEMLDRLYTSRAARQDAARQDAASHDAGGPARVAVR